MFLYNTIKATENVSMFKELKSLIARFDYKSSPCASRFTHTHARTPTHKHTPIRPV